MRGIDVSHYNGWPFNDTTEKAYKESDFVIVKATQGESNYKYADYFTKAATRISNDNKLLGAYHYAAGGDPIKEADYFVSVVGKYLGKAVLFLDWEQQQNKSWGDTTWVQRFIERVNDHTTSTCFVYTNMDGCKQCAAVADIAPLWFAGYPMSKNSWEVPAWPKRYTTAPWQNYTIWQFTSGDKTGYVDRNITTLTVDDWNYYANPTKEKLKAYSGKYPALPPRGYYRRGDGITSLKNYRTQIKRVQKLINWIAKTDLNIDGQYGTKTEQAVKRAQYWLATTQDGEFGKETLRKAKMWRR